MKSITGVAFDGLAVVELSLRSSPFGGPVFLAGNKVVVTSGPLILEIVSTVSDTWPSEVLQKARELLDAVETHLASRPPFTLVPQKREASKGVV